MSAKEVKDLVDQIKAAKDALDLADTAFQDARVIRNNAMDNLSSLQNQLAVELQNSNFIGGDYSIVKRQGEAK